MDRILIMSLPSIGLFVRMITTKITSIITEKFLGQRMVLRKHWTGAIREGEVESRVKGSLTCKFYVTGRILRKYTV